MEGIDIITSQGEVVEGLYQKLVESIAQCRYQCLYNWKFDGILIPPTYVEMDIVDDVVWINEGVSVDEEDVVRIYSLEPPAPEPNILVGLPPKPRDGQRYFSLPQKGKDIIVTDFVDGNRHEHLMKWNGMRPIYTSTTIKKGYNDDEK